jgi:hypothetical protein
MRTPHISSPGRIAGTLLVTMLGLLTPAAGQTRGSPLYLESVYGARTRAGLEFRHDGELEGGTLTLTGVKNFGVGVRRRFTVSAALGVWGASRGADQFIGSLGAQYRLGGPSVQGEVSNVTIRAISGVGVVGDAGRARFSVPVGVGIAYTFPWPVVQLEPWVVPHLIWLQRAGDVARSALPAGKDKIEPGISAGLTLGAGLIGGIRIAAECCVGGVAASYGLSAWF